MKTHEVVFDAHAPVLVPTGTLITEAARSAGAEIDQPCGGQGRCGRCAVRLQHGQVRQRSTLRLSAQAAAEGYALACQSVIEGPVAVIVPEGERLQRRMVTDREAAEAPLPPGYDPAVSPPVRSIPLEITPPTMDDQTDDWSRLQRTLRREGIEAPDISLPLLRDLGRRLRSAGWKVEAVIDLGGRGRAPRLVDVRPQDRNAILLGAAIDIGTTTVTVRLVNLRTGRTEAQAAEYNRQVRRGEDVISRIIYAGKGDGAAELRALVVDTINDLLDTAARRAGTSREAIYRAAVAGNSTMMHLFLGIPAESIRLSPFVTAANQPPALRAGDIGLAINPEAVVDCLPGVASYVGADITAGVLAAGMSDSEDTSLFIDIGTNGEIVLGSRDWLVACACSAGPAFEGAGVADGMRATRGAIEEVWIHSQTFEPTLRVIGGVRPSGICGSGLLSLLAELFQTGLVDKAGKFNLDASTDRVRLGNQGPEYVLVSAEESASGQPIVLNHVDIDNLLRAKAAIYAGFTVLADAVGVPLDLVSRVLIGGAFGKYINVEKAVEIGLLPDMPWDRFHFLGNTAVQGAHLALLSDDIRERLAEIAGRMTYIELSADNAFYDAFTSALFLPHTDASRFPSVRAPARSLEALPT